MAASLAFKPRQTNQSVQAQQRAAKLAPSLVIPAGVVVTPSPASSSSAAQVGASSASASAVSETGGAEAEAGGTGSDLLNSNTSFDVPDPYDPSRPSDYIAYCQERLELRRVQRLEGENRQRMQEQERARASLEEERRAALQRGDYQSLLLSVASTSGGDGPAGATGGVESAGRGRGRGALSNLPAWMVQQIQASSATAPATDSTQFVDADAESADALCVGVKRGRQGQGSMGKPSCVVLLKNMVGPAEVDAFLEGETQQECLKYGPVSRCVIRQVPAGPSAGCTGDCPDDERVRTFVQFESQESAVKAYRDMTGRFFAGRRISAAFYDEGKFARGELEPAPGEW
ncbi:hypothetical protein B484DRAFT_447030 [Ochromonadaceae sp. CCMP2298]|nr:hypothetical protein B484DRAFT_447030 [Ochromonadaceae sp. CCMP2298]